MFGRRILSILCAVAMLMMCMLPIFAASQPIDRSLPLIPLSKDKDYEISLTSCNYYSDYNHGKILTDGQFCRYSYHDDRDMFVAFTGNKNFKVEVTVDLGYVENNISAFSLMGIKYLSLNIYSPTSVTFYTSLDNENFTLLGEGSPDIIKDKDELTVIYRLNPEYSVAGRYIKVVANGKKNTLMYLGEYSVYKNGNCYSPIENTKDGDVIIDDYGVGYLLNNGVAEVVSYEDKTQTAITYGALTVTDSDLCTDETQYTIGKGTGHELTVDSKFVDFYAKKNSTIPNRINYIVIHNTAVTAENGTNNMFRRLMLNNENSEATWHFTVDNSNTIYQNLAINMVGWHAGDIMNYQSIGIEMCVNGAPMSGDTMVFGGSAFDKWVDGIFSKTITNTAVLVAELLVKYNLGIDSVIQHYDVTRKNCPQWMRYSKAGDNFIHEGDLWIDFMKQVNYYYSLYTSEGTKTVITKAEKNVILYDYIYTREGNVYKVNAISAGAFANKEDIESIEISEYITKISKGAFTGSKIKDIITDNNPNYSFKNGALKNILTGEVIYSGNNKILVNFETIDNTKIITNIPAGTTIEALEKSINKETGAMNSHIICTKDKITIDGIDYIAIVMGDINCDGDTTAVDYLIAKRIVLDTYSADKYQIRAAMISGSSDVSASDYLSIRRMVINK